MPGQDRTGQDSCQAVTGHGDPELSFLFTKESNSNLAILEGFKELLKVH